MRFYSYISDAKVDMLLPQVPGAVQRKVAAKLGFDIKLFSASLVAEQQTLENRVARLRAVEEHLLSEEQVGTPDKPASWIQGTVEAKLVGLGDDAVVFLAANPSRVIALAGSAHHLIGASAPARIAIPFSVLPAALLSKLNSQFTRAVESPPEHRLTAPEEGLGQLATNGASQETDDWINVVTWASEHASGLIQRIQFLAKRLISKDYQQRIVTLSTPLYVALAD